MLIYVAYNQIFIKKTSGEFPDVLHIKKGVNYLLILKASSPGNTAVSPSASSMRSSWLYLAMRSDLEAEPVLI